MNLKSRLEQHTYGDLIGACQGMRDVYKRIDKIAPTDISVLVTGETGTGKELIAKEIHRHSPRAKGPFVSINCGAIPENLLESELFGHVRGAFTGAHVTKRGLFEQANGGTLFLDEIGDMGLGLQGKLLRVLQDREIRPVGGNQSVKIDVRIVAATNRALRDEIEAGRFRRDLFYRLNVIPIEILPLRERPDDIPLLAEAFLRKHAGSRPRRLTPAAIEQLKRCTWEGNARELENVIERAVALCDRSEIGPQDLPVPGAGAPSAADATDLVRTAKEQQLTLAQLQELYIDQVLAQTGGNKVRAARILGINRRTLYRRWERQGELGAHGADANDEEDA
ncbi:MAG TPA: sigma-54 dependent transcriptional regulator [Myxococcota bacterium]|nr:sigma-54 dependent transcriptional regulator [Myxococcota bacterium]